MNRRVVVTGLGVISSIGVGKEAFWGALLKGASGISEISSFDTSNYTRHYGGEVKNFDFAQFVEHKKITRFGRASALAISAGKLSLKDACLELDIVDREKVGIILGTTMGESQILEEMNEAWIKRGATAIDSTLIPKYPAYVLSGNVAHELKVYGYNSTIPTACAAGNYAIGYSYDFIKNGKADIMLAGGVDAFSRLAFIGFNRLLAVAPEKCQPFDKYRKGMLVGEGAGIVVLEEIEHALQRGAPIYAEVMGYGLSCDAHNMTAPEPHGVAQAIQKALYDSGIKSCDVDYISAHGTGTVTNDKVECLAFKNVFGAYVKKAAISSVKSMLGHTMGAASAIEAIVCCLAIKNDIVPPTINYETPDPECDIDCVPNVARQCLVSVALNNSLAFGGNNAALVLKKITSF